MLLVHLTDLHFGCADPAALTAAAKYIAEQKPDAVICTGDISRDGLSVELGEACSWLRALPAPVIITPGNHDVPYYNLWGRIFEPFSRFRRASHGLRVQPWASKDWHIVPINTARGLQPRLNWAQGAISVKQTQEAAAELAKAAPGALRIVITHHPLDWPSDAPIKGATIGGQAAMDRLMDAGAELFLSGHLHFSSARLERARALSITSGTLSKRLRHEPCGFTALSRPAPDVIEAEAFHIVQGVAEAASKRKFQFKTSASGAPTEMHAVL